MSHNVEFAAKSDVLKTASALVTQRLFQQKPLDDRVWVISTALTIIGFVSYQLLVNSWLDTSTFAQGSAKVATDDIIKFSTMFAVSRLLSGGSLSDSEWIKDSGLFIGSLVMYDLLFHNLVAERTAHLDTAMGLAVNDTIKLSIVFTINNFAKSGKFDKEWALTSGGFITGLVIYDVLIAKYTEGKF